TLYRQIVSRIGSHASQHKHLPEFLTFVEEKTAQSLGLRRVKIIINSEPGDRDESNNGWVEDVLRISGQQQWKAVENETPLTARGFNLAYPLRRHDRVSGLVLIDGPSGSLTPDARAVLEVLAGQVAIAIEDWRLVEENVSLERQLAERER